MKTRSKSIFSLFTVFALLASLLGSTVFVSLAQASPVNLVLNSGFENLCGDLPCNWNPEGGPSSFVASTNAHTGTYSLLVTGFSGRGATSDCVSGVPANTLITMDYWFNTQAGGVTNGYGRGEFYSDSNCNNNITNVLFSGFGASNPGTWVLSHSQYTSPAGTNSARFSIIAGCGGFVSACPATVLYDDVSVTIPVSCPPGQYDNGSGCVEANPGYYVPLSGATEQTPCDVSTYQPNAGAVSCISASPGHYVNVTAAAMQIACQPGTYQPNAGSILCVFADPGYFVDVSGAVEQTPCPAGYISDAGATECILAPDVTAPTITLTTPANGATYLLNQSVIADYACQDEAGGSGLASCVGTVPDGSAIDTSSVGAKSFTVNAADNPGNLNSATVSYNVVYNFSGFSSPVDIAPTLNVAKAGQSIPLKFRITDANGLPVTSLSGVSVTVASLSCSSGTTTDALEEYASGNSGLQSLGDGYYQFNWSTPKTYANSCKTLKLNLGEGSSFERTALFKFTK